MLSTIKHVKLLHSNWYRCYSTVKANIPKQETSEFEPVFSFPFIKYVAILNRLKVYQILGSAIAIPSCGVMEALNAVPSGAFFSSAYIGLTGAAVLSIATLPFRNTIGFLYISEDNQKVKISSMDFWGRRKDKIISTEEWLPLLDLGPKTLDPIFLSPQLSDGTKYKLFIKFGNVLNSRKMGQVLE